MFPGGGGNPNPNMGIPGFGMPPQNANIISAAPTFTNPRFPMGMNPMMGGLIPGGMGMMPNTMLPNPMAGAGMFAGMVPNMANQGNVIQQNPVPIQQEQPVELVDPALRKVFVKNIPENTPDAFMESILKECGNIIQWKRTKDQKDRPASFGYCEFDSIEAVLRCLRVMNNLKLLDNYLTIKASEKTEDFLGEWIEIKKKEWEAMKDQSSSKEEEFERYLQKDDAKALENIHAIIDKFDVNKVKEEKEKEEEKKEHPKEKERERRKKMQQKELERNFQKELSRWEYEDKIEREVRRERERERERERHREREKQDLLERELDYDSDRERRRRADPKALEQRKRARQRELEEDEFERRKEQMEEEEKKRAQEEGNIEIEPPLENILPPQMPIEEEAPTQQQQPEQPAPKKPRAAKFSFQPVEPVPMPTESQPEQPAEPVQTGGFQIGFSLGQKGKDEEKKNVFAQNSKDEDDDMLYQRKPKLNIKLEKPTEVTKNVITMDLNKKEANIKFNVTTKVDNAPNADEQKKLSDLEQIVSKIPKTKAELFDYKLNWAIIATSDLVEKKVKPWLFKQSKEYIGQEEAEFVNIILKRLANRDSPQQVLKRVEKLLDEDAEDFVMKLWRMLIFESLKLEHAS